MGGCYQAQRKVRTVAYFYHSNNVFTVTEMTHSDVTSLFLLALSRSFENNWNTYKMLAHINPPDTKVRDNTYTINT